MDVEKLKMENWNNEVKSIVDKFRSMLLTHFKLIDERTKNLIESRNSAK